jgi:hypothetical protein
VGSSETDKAEAAIIPKPLSVRALVATGFARKQAATGYGGACSLVRTSLCSIFPVFPGKYREFVP